MYKRWTWALVLSLLVILAGCNLFEWTHPRGSNNDADVLIADGYAALEAGDYGAASDYFARAMSLEPRSSDARKGHAISYAKANQFSIVNFVSFWLGDSKMSEVAVAVTSPVTPQAKGVGDFQDNFDIGNYANFAVGSQQDLETVINTLINDLNAIAWGFCDGVIPRDDVSVNAILGLCKLVRAGIEANILSDAAGGTGGLVVRESTKEFDVICLPMTDRLKIRDTIREAIPHFDVVAAQLDVVEEWTEARDKALTFIGDAHPELCNGLLENVCTQRETDMGCSSGFAADAACDQCADYD